MREPKPVRTSEEWQAFIQRSKDEGVEETTFAEMMASIGYDVDEPEAVLMIGAPLSMPRHPNPQEEEETEGERDDRIGEEGSARRHGVVLMTFEHGHHTRLVDGLAAASGAPEVPQHQAHADEVQAAADDAEAHHRADGRQRFQEVRIRQRRARGVGRVEHQALHDAGHPHGGDVDQDAEDGDPEVEVRQRH